MKTNWEKTIAAWNLAEAGLWDAALDAAHDDPSLVSVLSQRRGPAVHGGEPVVFGWQSYNKGDYQNALDAFLIACANNDDGWLKAWAQLGVAKVASDSGWWRVAMDWCAVAWLTSSKYEHLDLMAQIAGARGEILLRAGRPIEAASAFAEDQSLLGPGNRYRGRLRCYQAHAWSRSGRNGQKAAILAYRLAMHSVGEDITSDYAAAGLALLAARNNDPSRLPPNQSNPITGLPGFWITVAKARLAGDKACLATLLERAGEILPREYFAEHWWLAGWSRALGSPLFSFPILSDCFPTEVPQAAVGEFTLVESPVAGHELCNAVWWGESPSVDDADAWWAIRDSFMP